MKMNADILPLRIIKTTIAFFISITLAPLLNIDSFFAGLGSLKTMSQSITLSIQVVLEQMFANLMGFIYAIIYASIFGLNAISITFAFLTLFLSIKKIKFFDTYIPAGVTLIAIMMFSNNQQDLLDSAFMRILSTFIGMIIALIINIIIFRPKPSRDTAHTLQTLNEYIHIYLNNNYEEYIYLQINEQLQKLDKEKSIIDEELKFAFNKQEKIQRLNDQLLEIEIAHKQVDVIFEIQKLKPEIQEILIPILLQLNYIKQYPNDKEEIIQIKKQVKAIYNEYTDDTNFFTNTRFLSTLSNYIELLLDY